METIEKITKSDPPRKEKPNINERIQIYRFWGRLILALFILIIYAGTIYSLLYHVEGMDDKSASLSQVMVGALTVVLSQIGQYMWGSDKTDEAKEEQPKQEEKKNDSTTTTGVIKSLVIDTATNLAKTHVEEVVKKNLSEDQQKVLDKLIDEDGSHDKKSLTDFLK